MTGGTGGGHGETGGAGRPVRVRFAPSPTGSLHVGGARTALYNLLFARRHGGTFLLRIEDTDVDRNKPELVDQILEAMRWLGLGWDEGPYLQSARYDLYRAAADRLLAEGKAYRAFETPDELDAARAAADAAGTPYRYAGAGRTIPKDESDRRAAAGDRFVVRLRMPDAPIVVNDLVQGRAEFPPDALDDFVLLRSDGHPLYHFSVCVDDVEMRITHVIRGVDHLANTPKHVALFAALGHEPPVFAHLGMILGADGKKLSKRHGAAGVEEFRAQGYLPEALANFLALLGWSPGDDRERMTMAEMASLFSLERLGPSPSRFDHEKLAWLNAAYLQDVPEDRLVALLRENGVALDDAVLRRALPLHKPRAKTLVELAAALSIYAADPADYEAKGLAKFGKPEVAASLRALAERWAAVAPFRHAALEEEARRFAAEKELKLGDLAQPVRLALTGTLASPPLFDVVEILGEPTTRRRILMLAERIEST